MTEIVNFRKMLYSDWLPSFCDARSPEFNVAGFVEDSLTKVSDFDAKWFLYAMESGLVIEKDGFFTAPMSKAKEQIFWEGNRGESIRKLFLWAEPVITIGACGRLVSEFGWPNELIGAQSKKPWPFDLVCYGNMSKKEVVVCEVKKQTKEIDALLKHMTSFCGQPPLEGEPENKVEQNAYRKIVGIRKSWPRWFWALGPNGYSELFEIVRGSSSDCFSMNHVNELMLEYTRST